MYKNIVMRNMTDLDPENLLELGPDFIGDEDYAAFGNQDDVATSQDIRDRERNRVIEAQARRKGVSPDDYERYLERQATAADTAAITGSAARAAAGSSSSANDFLAREIRGLRSDIEEFGDIAEERGFRRRNFNSDDMSGG